MQSKPCFQGILDKIINFCPEFSPHSAVHQILALQLTNCYRVSAGLYKLNCADALNVDSPNQKSVKNCLKQLGNDEIGTLLGLYAQQIDRIQDGCFYLTINNFNQKAAVVSRNLLNSSINSVNQLDIMGQKLGQNIEVSTELQSQFQALSVLLQVHEKEQISAFKEVVKTAQNIANLSTNSQKILRQFSDNFQTQAQKSNVIQNNIFQSMKQLGISVENLDFNVESMEKSSKNIVKGLNQSNKIISEQLEKVINIDANLIKVENLSQKSIESLIDTYKLIDDNQQKVSFEVTKINAEISQILKNLDNIKFTQQKSIFSILPVQSGFISFHIGVLSLLYLCHMLFSMDFQPIRRIAMLFLGIEISIVNFSKLVSHMLFCNIYVPIFVKFNKLKLFKLGRSDLLQSRSYNIYAFLKGSNEQQCMYQPNLVAFSYLIRFIEIFILLKIEVVEYLRGNKVDKYVSTPQRHIKHSITPNQTMRASNK